jgi:hypothetical protein
VTIQNHRPRAAIYCDGLAIHDAAGPDANDYPNIANSFHLQLAFYLQTSQAGSRYTAGWSEGSFFHIVPLFPVLVFIYFFISFDKV